MVAVMENHLSTQLRAIAPPSLHQLTGGFAGRSHILNQIDHWIQQNDQRFFVLMGEPGVGKSAIAAHLIQTRTDIVARHFCELGVEQTVQPIRVLRSLAAQLDQAFPYYGDALLNTIKSTLSAEVKIEIDKIEDLIGKAKSKVKRVEINHLKTSDIVNEFDILLRAPLAALPQFYKDQGKNPPELAIIVIDGLDVAVTMKSGVQEDEDLATLFAALAEDESLPSWIRFIFTTRPDRRVLREFEPLKPYLLNEQSPENLADIRQYVTQRIGAIALHQQGAATSKEAQAWVEQLTARSQGNFRFIKSMLDDLEAGRCSLNDLPAIPEDLAKYYADDFNQRFPKQEWGDRHQQILKVLAEANDPLSEEQLAILTEIAPRQLRQDLWVLRQYLDVHWVAFCRIEDVDRKVDHYETFTIFHNSLKAYLTKNFSAAVNS
jgi:hypothetical protein